MIAIFLFIYVIFGSTVEIYANGAPSKVRPHSGGNIQPYNEPNIKIKKEILKFSGLKNDGWYYKTMDVSVEYIMENTSNKDIELDVVFPYDSPSGEVKNMRVSFNNSPVSYSKKQSPVYFGTFKVNNSKFLRQDDLRLPDTIIFRINFKPQSTSTLNVTYTQYGGFDRTEKRIDSFIYYLQPAKYWADFKDLSIYIDLPQNYNLNPNMKFDLTSENLLGKTYYLHSDGLPEEDLYFEIYSTGPSILNRVAWVVVFIVLLLIVLKIFLSRRIKSKAA
ncbi:MAG: hypothetical protein ACOYWZ_05445 [Bacillota bacterium]